MTDQHSQLPAGLREFDERLLAEDASLRIGGRALKSPAQELIRAFTALAIGADRARLVIDSIEVPNQGTSAIGKRSAKCSTDPLPDSIKRLVLLLHDTKPDELKAAVQFRNAT